MQFSKWFGNLGISSQFFFWIFFGNVIETPSAICLGIFSVKIWKFLHRYFSEFHRNFHEVFQRQTLWKFLRQISSRLGYKSSAAGEESFGNVLRRIPFYIFFVEIPSILPLKSLKQIFRNSSRIVLETPFGNYFLIPRAFLWESLLHSLWVALKKFHREFLRKFLLQYLRRTDCNLFLIFF